MAWTNVSKPTSSVFSRVTVSGRNIYDDTSVSYDDTDVFYDSFNINAWTNVVKPSVIAATSASILAGMATGLICPPTYAITRSIVVPATDNWTNVNKPT